jgi:phosphoribosyl-AMP cyclohydrolase / phosphoribosyl-ATP pyrophosphohydrolase
MNINFEKYSDGLVPAIIQHAETLQVLMLGYMSQEAYQLTIKERVVHFYSRSKKRIWKKGESSGNILHLVDIQIDCDEDALLIKVRPEGPICHKGSYACFGNQEVQGFLYQLEGIIKERIQSENTTSYTKSSTKWRKS